MSRITLVTGAEIDVCDPDPAAIDIDVIARGLSNCCRFGGQVVHFYSVAQHSLHCSEIVSDAFALEALLHDAAEAIIHDITTPLKRQLPDYQVIEARMDAAVRARFGLPPVMSAQVAFADRVLLATEWRDIKGRDPAELDGRGEAIRPETWTIRPYAPAVAHTLFMDRFNELTGGKR